MITLVLAVLGAMTAVMVAGWLYQRAAGNGGWTDVFWTFGTGGLCALAALAPIEGVAAPSWRQMAVAALAAIWALRLGTYVMVRVAGKPEDTRYAGLRRDWGPTFQRNMFGLLVIQAPATALLSISVLLAARNPSPALRPADLIGVAILVIAILGEGLADTQMKRFKAEHGESGAVCDTGLWSWSRHPNYFFEAFGWLAYPIIAIQPSQPWTWASVIAPVVMYLVLRCGTGVPPLEAAMLRSKGDAYRRYQARVSPLLLRPPKEAPS